MPESHLTDSVRTTLTTWPELFAVQVRQRPGAVAVVFEDTALTYGELDERANRLARALIARGAGPERVVGLCLPRSLDLIVAEVAVLKAGAAYLPIDPEYPAERIGYLLADAVPISVLTTAGLASAVDTAPARMLLDDPDVVAELAGRSAADLGDTGLTPAGAAYVIYTSGSTGRPKGVVMTHAGVAKLLATGVERLAVGPHSRVLQFASPSFDVAFFDLCLGLLTGGRLIVVPADRRVPGPALTEYAHAPRRHLHDPAAGAAGRDAGRLRSAGRGDPAGRHRAGLGRAGGPVGAEPADVQCLRADRGDGQLDPGPLRPGHPARSDRADRGGRPGHPVSCARRRAATGDGR